MLKSTQNTRAILPNNPRYIRSDVPDKLTGEETEWLVGENITTIADLRTEEERKKRKCPLAEDNRFRYLCMPVTGGNVVPESVDDVSKSYVSMVDEQMEKIIEIKRKFTVDVELLCESESGCGYSCDYTG